MGREHWNTGKTSRKDLRKSSPPKIFNHFKCHVTWENKQLYISNIYIYIYTHMWITKKKTGRGKGNGGKDTFMLWLQFQISPALCHNKSYILLLSLGLCYNIPWSLCFAVCTEFGELYKQLLHCDISSLFPSKVWSKPTLLGKQCFGELWLPEPDSLLTDTNTSTVNVCSLLAKFVMCFWFPASEMHFG